MEIGLFGEFFDSLSQISPLNIEVWNAKGLVIYSRKDRATTSGNSEIRSLSERIMREGTFQDAVFPGKYNAYGVPVKKGEEIVGSLVVYGSNIQQANAPMGVEPPGEMPLDAMKSFVARLAGLMEDRLNNQQENEKMAEELTQNFEDLYLYSTIATQVKTLRFSNAMLTDLIHELLETMRSHIAFALLPDRPEYNALKVNEAFSDRIADPYGFIKTLLKTIPPDTPTLKENYFIVNDSRMESAFRELYKEPYRFLVVTIKHNKNFYGWLGLVSFELKEIFRRGELRLLISMAEQLAVIITNTDLYRDLEQFVINMVRSLVNAIEAKDVYTRGHSERVSRYCALMADYLKLDQDQKDILHWAAILHDVGKIGITENILNKSAMLTDEEYETIKGHPSKGFTILQPLGPLVKSLPGILHHHERYDGNGYPDRLKGKEIPLMARIIAVADTFDAISSSRAYRRAKSQLEAIKIVEKAAGSQLDPELIEVFKEVFSKEIQGV